MDGYTYTSTTTDSNGNVVSETKKSSTKTGGTERKRDVELFPTLTYDDENYIFKQSVVQPGRNQYDKRPAFGIDNASNDERRKGTAVLREGHDMGEGRDFSKYFDILKGMSGKTRESATKYYHINGSKGLTAGERAEIHRHLKTLPTIKDVDSIERVRNEEISELKSKGLSPKFNATGYLDKYETDLAKRNGLGKRIGNAISGDASCGDMGVKVGNGFVMAETSPDKGWGNSWIPGKSSNYQYNLSKAKSEINEYFGRNNKNSYDKNFYEKFQFKWKK